MDNGGEIGGDLVVVNVTSCFLVQTNAKEELDRFLGVIVFENHGDEADKVTETRNETSLGFNGVEETRFYFNQM